MGEGRASRGVGWVVPSVVALAGVMVILLGGWESRRMELFVIVVVVMLALPVAATVSVVRAAGPPGLTEVAWLLLIWLVPVVGPALWFIAGRRGQVSTRH